LGLLTLGFRGPLCGPFLWDFGVLPVHTFAVYDRAGHARQRAKTGLVAEESAMQTTLHTPATVQPSSAANLPDIQSGQYLTLRLGAESYAIDIMRVQEIRSYEEPTRMANAPSFIKGVINLRGVIVPIVDLRMKLSVSTVEYNEFTVVIVLNIRGTIIGAVVDAVSDVVTLDAKMVKPAPQFESTIDARFILGLAHVGERMLIVMNMDALLSNAELGMH
jgi:purine-binding chemotaxis protein CheW